MKKYMLKYKENIEKQIQNPNTDFDKLLEYHEKHILFFQHERLIHLIVTFLFAILTVLSIGVVIFAFSFPLLILSLIFLAMTIAYIMHYYFLENTVQEFYKTYDEICKKTDINDKKIQDDN